MGGVSLAWVAVGSDAIVTEGRRFGSGELGTIGWGGLALGLNLRLVTVAVGIGVDRRDGWCAIGRP